MQEIYRSRDMNSLMAKKQYLEENDVPCRILLEGTDITHMPTHPVFGLSYHLEEAASLMVDDEDGRKAWNLLNHTEYSLDEDEEGYYCEPKMLGGEPEPFGSDEGSPDDAYGRHSSGDWDEGSIDARENRNFARRVIPSIIKLLCLLISAVWIFYAMIFVSALWMEGEGTKDWAEDSLFLPLGIVMILIWVVGVILIIRRSRRGR